MMREDSLPLGAQRPNAGDGNEGEDEAKHFQDVCRSYQQYATFHHAKQRGVGGRLRRLLLASGAEGGAIEPTVESILPPSMRPDSSEGKIRQKQLLDATIQNQYFLDWVLKYSCVPTSQEFIRMRESSGGSIEWVTEDQASKVDSVLKSVARDWSAECKDERAAAYDPIIQALENHLPVKDFYSSNCVPRVAVPGSGLGRLAWEVYSRGYSVQGSDFSLPMLLASDFLLNGCGIPSDDDAGGGATPPTVSYRRFNISPWIAETKNQLSFEDRIRPLIVPDVNPSSLLFAPAIGESPSPEFTMLAGDLLQLYSHFLPHRDVNGTNGGQSNPRAENKFHAVACSFFLDTAPSLPHYLITIYHMLEDGGLLVSFGPLMYHWSGHGVTLPGDLDERESEESSVNKAYRRRTMHLDQRYLSSIDYTWDDLKHMVERCGFEILEENLKMPARYACDSRSMMKVSYDCAFLVARKTNRRQPR